MSPSIANDIPYLSYDDFAKGKEALVHYHNEMVRLYPMVYYWTLDELMFFYRQRPQGHKYAIEGIGTGIINSDASNRTVQEAMKNLAQAGKGKVPLNVSAFSTAIGTQMITDVDYVDLSSFVVSESVAQAIQGVATVGNKVLDIGDAALDSTKSLVSSTKWLIPLLIIGAAVVAYPVLAKKYL